MKNSTYTESPECSTEFTETRTFTITEEQLSALIERVSDKIKGTLSKEGRSAKGVPLANAVSDTIKAYLANEM